MAGVDVRWDTSADPKRGNAITFTKTNKLTAQTAQLPEGTDITPSALADSTVTVTLGEFGDAVQTTEKLRVVALQDLRNLIPMHEIGASMGESIDILARTNGFDTATNITFPGGFASDNAITTGAAGRINASLVARQRAFLAAAAVPTIDGLWYLGMVHPHVSFDLMGETGGRGWRDPHTYSDPESIYTSELGGFEGVRYVENPRSKINTAATNVDVYTTYIWGWQALAEARGVEPEVRLTGPFDVLARFVNTGWYGLIGWNVFRQESIELVRSSSSIGVRS
jgi:N4-gp56 family major capsid protein